MTTSNDLQSKHENCAHQWTEYKTTLLLDTVLLTIAVVNRKSGFNAYLCHSSAVVVYTMFNGRQRLH